MCSPTSITREMVTLIEEARIPWLFYDERPTATLRDGCVVTDLHVKYRAQIRHSESPIEVTMYVEHLRAVDFTVGYEVRPAGADPTSNPAVVASTQLVSFDVENQRLRRLTEPRRRISQASSVPRAGRASAGERPGTLHQALRRRRIGRMPPRSSPARCVSTTVR